MKQMVSITYFRICQLTELTSHPGIKRRGKRICRTRILTLSGRTLRTRTPVATTTSAAATPSDRGALPARHPHVVHVARVRRGRLLPGRHAAVVDLTLVADGAALLRILLLVTLILLGLGLGTRRARREFAVVLAAVAAPRRAGPRRRRIGMLREGRGRRRRRGVGPRQRGRRGVPGRRRRRGNGRRDLLLSGRGGGAGGSRAVSGGPVACGPWSRPRHRRRLGLVPVLLVGDPVEVRGGGGCSGGRRRVLMRVVPVSAVVVGGVGGPLLRGGVVRGLLVVVELLLHLVAPVLVVPPPGGHAPEAAVSRVIRLEVRYVVVLSCCWVTGRLVVSSHARHVFDQDELSLSNDDDTHFALYHCTGTGTHFEAVMTSMIPATSSHVTSSVNLCPDERLRLTCL